MQKILVREKPISDEELVGMRKFISAFLNEYDFHYRGKSPDNIHIYAHDTLNDNLEITMENEEGKPSIIKIVYDDRKTSVQVAVSDLISRLFAVGKYRAKKD